jgi:hypothetical protein
MRSGGRHPTVSPNCRAIWRRVWAATSRVLRPANPIAAVQGKHGLVDGDAGRGKHETGVPASDRTIEPRRVSIGEQPTARERVRERELSDLPGGDLRIQEVTVPDRALEAAVCCALASSFDAAGATAPQTQRLILSPTFLQ